MIKICKAGAFHQLKPKLHVNQLNSIGAIEAGIKLGAVSLDHLETVTEEEIHRSMTYRSVSSKYQRSK